MGFLDKDSQKATNPATKFLSWNSNEKCFTYYDKQKETNVHIGLPLKFIVMKELATVKGWSDEQGSGIYSNEVESTIKQPLTVKYFKGGTVAKGLYQKIREKVVAAGGKYHQSIYCMLEDGSLVNISLKGAAMSRWLEFTQKSRSRLSDEWVSVPGFDTDRKGGVTFNVPAFRFEGTLTEAQYKAATSAATVLSAYLSDYLAANAATEGGDTQKASDYPEASDPFSFTEDVEPIYDNDNLPF